MRPSLGAVARFLLLLVLSNAILQCAIGQHHGHGDQQPVPFSYCKQYLERLSNNDQHQLRESYQEYHAAYARFMRAQRNKDAFAQGAPTWMQTDEQRQGWNLTYIVGNNLENLTRTFQDAEGVMQTMENRIKAQLQQLESAGSLPASTGIDDLSPCIMRKIYPTHFPDQPAVSLLLRLRGEVPNPGDWPPSTSSTTEPPTGKGPEAVAAFISRARQCASVTPLELIVMLSGPTAATQATTWAWQSWQSEGFVVPILDMLDREAHALNRMASVARGSVLVALRGDRPLVDDLLLLTPTSAAAAAAGGGQAADCSWLQRIVTLYHRIPALGAMAHGRFAFSHPASLSPPASSASSSSPGALRLLGRVEGAGGPAGTNMYFKEKMTSVPFQYVLYGDYSPMSFRRSALEEVGGFDEDLPQGPEPCSGLLRLDFCLRLWKSGWRVGAHDAGLLQQPAPPEAGGPGANSDLTKCPPDVAALAARLVGARHNPPPPAGGATAEAGGAPSSSSALSVLEARVRQLNLDKLEPLGPGALQPCPMEQGC